MVGAPAAADAVARARRLPNLRVGLHAVLVDGDPISDRTQIPDLIDAAGRFRSDLARYGTQIMLSASTRRQMTQEITAQFEAYRATGLALDHVNAHRHFHLHPTVASSIIAIGPRYGMRALRIPAEPRQILAAIEPPARRSLAWLTAPFVGRLRAQAHNAGLTMTDAVFGLAWSGAMTAARLAALLERLPDGTTEIYLHPATANTFPGAAPGYRYREELSALCDAGCREALQRSGYPTGGYADIAASH
jgi:hopanoid biosynthesis associated protein HpnK